MSNSVLYGQIKSLVNINDNPHYAGFDVVEKTLYLGEQISHALRSIYSSLKGKGEAPYTIDELSEALETFYADYVAPIDLPMNNFLEGILDRNVPGLFKPALLGLQEKLNDWQSKRAS